MTNTPRILFAILNWGLGHATRTMPIIDAALAMGSEVMLASDGRALDLLKAHYRDLEWITLPSYGVSYRSKSIFMNLLQASRPLLYAMRKEKTILEDVQRAAPLDLVISDNRYGCYLDQTKSICMTHQIRIHSGNQAADQIARRLVLNRLKRFDQIWVPDYPGRYRLSGELCEVPKNLNVRFVGPLSTMQRFETDCIYDIIAVISGPEPQRTRFEERVVSQMRQLAGYQCLVVQGKPEAYEKTQLARHITCVSFMDRKTLNKAMLASRYIVSRTGYSTIMDLAKIGRRALLVPTPGQPEQEYLGRYHAQQGFFIVQDQASLDIAKGIHELQVEAMNSPGFMTGQKAQLEEVLRDSVSFP